MAARAEVKNIKVSPECKRLLGLAKRSDERYEDMLLRLLKENEGEKEEETIAEEGEKNGKETIKNLSTEVEGFLSDFGLNVKDIYNLIDSGQKIESLKLRRPQGKPLDLTKTAKTLIWAIVSIISIKLSLPVTSEIMRWFIG